MQQAGTIIKRDCVNSVIESFVRHIADLIQRQVKPTWHGHYMDIFTLTYNTFFFNLGKKKPFHSVIHLEKFSQSIFLKATMRASYC